MILDSLLLPEHSDYYMTTPEKSLPHAEQIYSAQDAIKSSIPEDGNNPPHEPGPSQSNNEESVQKVYPTGSRTTDTDIEPSGRTSPGVPLTPNVNEPRNWFNRLWNWLQADVTDGRKFVPVVAFLLSCLCLGPFIHPVTIYGHNMKPNLEGVSARILYLFTLFAIFLLLASGFRNKYYKKGKLYSPFGISFLRYTAGFAVIIFGFLYEFGYLYFCEQIHNHHHHTQLLSQHIECNILNTLHRIVGIFHYFFIGLFIIFNEHIPRENRLHLILLTIASTGIFVTLIWTVIKEEIFIDAEIFKSANDTQTHDFGFNVDTFEELSTQFYVAILEALIVAFVIIGGVILDVRERKNNSSPQENDSSPQENTNEGTRNNLFTVSVGFCIAVCTFALIYSEKKKKYNSESITWITTYLLSNLLIQGIGIATLLFFMTKSGNTLRQPPDGQGATRLAEEQRLVDQEEVANVRHWIGYLDRLWFYFGFCMMLLYVAVSLWNDVYNLIYAITSTKEHSLYLAITEFFNTFFSLIQALLQGWLILFYFNNNYNLVMRVDIKLCGKEIGYWLGSYVLCPTEGCNLNWWHLVAALAPGCVFFRFHSFAMMIEALNEYDPEK